MLPAIPGPLTMARSQDVVDWSDLDLGGLTPSGPEGYLWNLYFESLLAHDGAVIVPMGYRPDISGTSLGLQIRGDPGVRLTEVEPGVYRARSYHMGDGGTVRFEDTGSGLHVIDHESGDPLAFLDGASMEYIERWTSRDGIQSVRKLAILGGDTLVDVPLPEVIEEAQEAQFHEDDSGFVAYSIGPDRRLYIHRSRDGRDWIESDVIGDDPGEPTDLEAARMEQGRLVVYSEEDDGDEREEDERRVAAGAHQRIRGSRVLEGSVTTQRG
jgi:hypothetical protein